MTDITENMSALKNSRLALEIVYYTFGSQMYDSYLSMEKLILSHVWANQIYQNVGCEALVNGQVNTSFQKYLKIIGLPAFK